MVKKIFFLLFISVHLYSFSQTKISVEKLLDSVENYYTTDKENAFKLLKETNLENSTEKNLNLARYYKLKAYVYKNVEEKNENFYTNIKKAISIAKQLKAYALLGELYVTLSATQLELSLVDQAENSAKKALFYYKKAKVEDGVLDNIFLQSEILYQKGLFEESRDLILAYKSKFENHEDKYFEIFMNYFLGEIFLDLKEIDSSFACLNNLKNVNLTKLPQENLLHSKEEKAFYIATLEFQIANELVEKKGNLDEKEISFIKNVLKNPIEKVDEIRLKELKYELASKFYLKTNQLQLSEKYNDSLIKYIRANAVKGSKYMSESTEKILDMEDKVQKVENHKKRWLFVSIIFAILTFVLFINTPLNFSINH